MRVDHVIQSGHQARLARVPVASDGVTKAWGGLLHVYQALYPPGSKAASGPLGPEPSWWFFLTSSNREILKRKVQGV